MLIGFKVKNFRSFGELSEFSMLAGKVRNNENQVFNIGNKKVLKFSGMYGANGSGKSNFMLAIGIVKDILKLGVTPFISNQYYRGSVIKKNVNSYFEYELYINNRFYSYGFEINFNSREIVSEWLIDMTKSKEKIIFERDLKKKISRTDLKKNISFETCLKEMENNKKDLFLNEMCRRLSMTNNNDSYFTDIINTYLFFMKDMIVIRPQTHRIFDTDYIKKKDKILKELKALDINIIDIITEESDIKVIENKLPNNIYLSIKSEIDNIIENNKNHSCTLRIENDMYIIKKGKKSEYIVEILKFVHENTDSLFGTYEESDGTIRVLELLDILLSKGKLFIIDELDSSLHPILVNFKNVFKI